jgi:hypothetical protein
MDEYLFLVMAKLKADRRKLLREQRAQLYAPDTQPARIEAVGPRVARDRGSVFRRFEWREQS